MNTIGLGYGYCCTVLVTMFLGLQTPVFAQGDQSMTTFRWSSQVAPSVLAEFCPRSFYQVSILKNAQNRIGGYVLQPAIMDAPIPYLDCEGQPLTTFHIFGSDVEKKKATKIIDPLIKRFPIREALVCPPAKANK